MTDAWGVTVTNAHPAPEMLRAGPIERRLKCSQLQSQPSTDAIHIRRHKDRTQSGNRILLALAPLVNKARSTEAR